MIKPYKRNQIDIKLWNDCVLQSTTPSIYGLSWYLDAVAPRWSALVIDKYRAVLPIANAPCFVFRRCYQPWFTQQLGVFRDAQVDAQTVDALIESLQKTYRWGQYSLSSENIAYSNIKILRKTNHILSLNAPYSTLRAAYRRNTRRILAQAHEQQLCLSTSTDCDMFTSFLQQHLPRVFPAKQLQKAANLALACIKNDAGTIFWVRDTENMPLAAALVAWLGSHFYFLICASSPQGHTQGAMYYLVDQLIQKTAQELEIFDFCGSSLQGVAYFNTGFGATVEEYGVLSW